jgi:hypothetical protein
LVNIFRCKNRHLKQKVLRPSAAALVFKSRAVKDKVTPCFLEYHLRFVPSLFMLTFSGTELGHETKPYCNFLLENVLILIPKQNIMKY